MASAEPEAVGAAGGDGLLQSPGLEFHLKGHSVWTPCESQMGGIAVKLLLSNSADVSDVSPDSLSGRVCLDSRPFRLKMKSREGGPRGLRSGEAHCRLSGYPSLF